MYGLRNVIAKQNRDWVPIDKETVTVIELLDRYDNCIIDVLMLDGITINQYYLRDFFQVHLANVNLKLKDYITNHSDVFPAKLSRHRGLDNVKRVTYHNLWLFGLAANRDFYTQTGVYPNEAYLPDIKITKPSRYLNQLTDLLDGVLFLVNGLVVKPFYANNSIYLLGASYLIDRYENQQLSVIDFSAVGGFTTSDIIANNLSPFKHTDHSSTVYLHVESSMRGKTPLLVINGHLHILDDWYRVINDHTIAITLNNNKIITELVNVPFNDITYVNETRNLGNGFGASNIDALKYLTQGNSSLVLLNTAELNINVENVSPTRFKDVYNAMYPPKGILFQEDGGIGDYIVSSATWYGCSINVTSPKLIKPIKNTLPMDQEGTVNNVSLGFKDTCTGAFIKNLYVI